MNAISYLVSRKATSPYKISVKLFIASILAWANLNVAQWLEHSHLVGEPFTWVTTMLVALTTLAYGAMLFGTALGAPLHHMSQMNATIKRFSENRILDELTSTGLTTHAIFRQLSAYHLKCVAIITIPSSLLWLLILGDLEVVILSGIVFLALALVHSVSVCLNCWAVAIGSRGKFFLIAPVVYLFGPPVILFQVAGFGRPVWLVSSLFVLATSYFLSVRALESRDEFHNVASSLRRVFRLKRKSVILSENAIVARQEAVGREWGDVFTLVVSVVALIFAMAVSVSTEAQWPVLNVLLVTGFVAAWRATSKLSQSLTSEMESSTLEILRTTPLGSERFLTGWLDLTLKPLFLELGVLCTAAFGFALTSFPYSLIDGTFAFTVLATMVMPYVGALFGASIAGQLKTRSEMAGQLTYIFLFCGVFTIPQMSVLLILGEPIWIHLVLSLGVTWLGCKLLKAGATKSLNRVFLPQK